MYIVLQYKCLEYFLMDIESEAAGPVAYQKKKKNSAGRMWNF